MDRDDLKNEHARLRKQAKKLHREHEAVRDAGAPARSVHVEHLHENMRQLEEHRRHLEEHEANLQERERTIEQHEQAAYERAERLGMTARKKKNK